MQIVFGIEVIQRASCNPEIIEIAAVVVDEAGREADCFQSCVNPGKEALAGLSREALEPSGISMDGLGGSPGRENVANSLRTFLQGL